MVFRVCILTLMVSASLLADTVVVRDSTFYHGRVVRIDGRSVFLEAGRRTTTIDRSAVVRIIFSASDLLILTAGDTLSGKVFRTNEKIVVFGTGDGLKEVWSSEASEIISVAGPAVTIAEISETDDSYTMSPVSVRKKRHPLYASLSPGTHWLSYLYPGNSYFRDAAFEKGLTGKVYGLDLGLEVGRRTSVGLGLFWITASTGIVPGPGIVKPERVGYYGGYLSGSYNILPESKFNLWLRIRLALLRGKSELWNSGADTGELKGALIPSIGVSYALALPIDLLLELGYQSADLPLHEAGSVVRLEGLVFSGGIRLHPWTNETD